MTSKKGEVERVPIYRHDEPTKSLELASYEGRYLGEIEDHIERFVGNIETVLHELVSPVVHVDIHVVLPNEKVLYLTLVTSGMSDLDMTVRPGQEPPDEYRLGEIITFLPPDWPMSSFTGGSSDGEADPAGWYPAAWMKHYARMPHQYETNLSWFNTTANGDPASPIEDGIGMVGFLFAPPLQLGPEGFFAKASDRRKIRFLNLVPIWPDEIMYAINKGGMALCDKLDRAENFVFDPNRPSCMKRKKLFGLF